MSDGPHKSLPMLPGWKRVAKCGDNIAFAPEEIGKAIVHALKQDCNHEIGPEFLLSIRGIFMDHESLLFKDRMAPRLDSLRETAGQGMGRIVLEHAIEAAERGKTGNEGLEEAVTNALTDRAARGNRQVEEHSCRKSTAPRAQKVRERIEEGIKTAPIKDLVRQILKLDPRPSASPKLKNRGLDDGVKI
jgi:hypothetical protein